jgi:hypothetical protein
LSRKTAKRTRTSYRKATISSGIAGYSLPKLAAEADIKDGINRLSIAQEKFDRVSAELRAADAELTEARTYTEGAYALPLSEMKALLGGEVDAETQKRIDDAIRVLCEERLSNVNGQERKRQAVIKTRPDGNPNQSLPEMLSLSEAMLAAAGAWRAGCSGPSESMLMEFSAQASVRRRLNLDSIFALLESEATSLRLFVKRHEAELLRPMQEGSILHQPYGRFICALAEIAEAAGMKVTATRNTTSRTPFTRFVMEINRALPRRLRRLLDEDLSFPSYIYDVIRMHRARKQDIAT